MALGELRGAALRRLWHIIADQLPEFAIESGVFALLLIVFALMPGRRLSALLAMALGVTAPLIAFIAGA
jgi:hypothetical protein